MAYYTIVLSSITYVNKAHDILTGNRIKSGIVKLTANRSHRGCGYGLTIEEPYLKSAVNLIESYHMKIIEIY